MSPEESFETDDALAERIEQAADQRDMPMQARLRREMIEIDRDRPRRGRRQDRVDIGDQPIVVDAFVIERRQHQRAGKAELGGVPGQRDGVGQGGSAGADHHPIERQAALGIGAHHPPALIERERCRFASGAEHIEPVAAGIEQEARQRDRARAVGLAVVVDRRRDRGDDAVQCLAVQCLVAIMAVHLCSGRFGAVTCACRRSSKACGGNVQSKARTGFARARGAEPGVK